MMKKASLTTLATLVSTCALSNAALVAHYKLDETSGTGALDSAGGNNAVQDSGTVSWTTGIIGGAVDIANTDLRINSNLLGGATAFTLSAWVNLDTSSTSYRGIFMSRGASNNGNWGFASNGAGSPASLAFDYRYDNTGAGSDGKDNLAPSAVGNWQHLAMVWKNDGTGTTYLNGAPGATKTGASTVFEEVGEATINWYIGSDIDRRNDAQIDDIAVWDEALTDTQVLAIYNGGLAGIDAPTSLIPEPSAAILALLGGLMAFRRRR